MPMLARVEGMPLESLRDGVPWDWGTTEEYLDRLDGTLAVNAGFMVGHSTIRRVVMGEDANERAARDESAAMVRLLSDGLTAGGIGFSSTWSDPLRRQRRPGPVPIRDRRGAHHPGRCRGEFDGTSLEFLPRTRPSWCLRRRRGRADDRHVAAPSDR